MKKRWLLATALLGIALAAVVYLAQSGPAGAGAPGALALETRLLAPCCWNGTLDTHESELAHSLRREIEERMAAGEPSRAVEADLVSRYGTKMRALPSEGALNVMLMAAFAMVAGAGIFVALRVRSWRRPSDEEEHAELGKAPRAPTRIEDSYDARIDDELAELD